MTTSPVRPFYRRFDKKLRQGDIAMAEFAQLRSPRDVSGPGPEDSTDENLPNFGRPEPYAIDVNGLDGRPRKRILFVWQGLVMVLHQNCEIDLASEKDSRLTIAPIVLASEWPG